MRTTLRDYIKRDLTERLGGGETDPSRLTLAALADRYGVSHKPVRQAIDELVAEGLLVRNHDGRVSVDPRRSKISKKSQVLARTNNNPIDSPLDRARRVEDRLAKEAIAASLRRNGGYLREEATARRLGVGRTVVRHAFGRLCGRGLLVHIPRKGWRPRDFDVADMRDYLVVRETLELKALELAAPRLEIPELERILARNVPRSHNPKIDNSLHEYIIKKSENAYIIRFFQEHGAFYSALFDYAAPEASVVAAMAERHAEILAALIDRDHRRAARALAAHIREQRTIVEGLLDRLESTDHKPKPAAPTEDEPHAPSNRPKL